MATTAALSYHMVSGIGQMEKRRHRFAFTLVELLVLIAISALLLGVLLPMIYKARCSAQRVVCARIMRQWGSAFQIYANNNRGYMPWKGSGDGNSPSKPIGPWADTAYWANALPPLMNKTGYYDIQRQDALSSGKTIRAVSTDNMFVCPAAGPCSSLMDREPTADGAFLMWGNPEGSPPQYNDPAEGTLLAPDQRKVYWSYVINSKLSKSVEDMPFVRADNLQPAGLIVLLVEKCMSPADVMPGYETQSLMRGKTTWTRFTTRHQGGGNLLFLDGHVEFRKAAELAAPKGHGYYKGEDADTAFLKNPAYNLRGVVIWDPNQSPLFP